MKLLEAIMFVRRPEEERTWDNPAPIQEMAEALGIQNPFYDSGTVLDERFKAYPIFNWRCTDEHVGLDALYLDGEPIGCIYRSARKASYEFQWISPEVIEKARSVILESIEWEKPKILDPMEEIGDTGTVRYAGEALTNKGLYNGKQVVAVQWIDERMGTDRVKVTDFNETWVIPVNQFEIPFNVDLPE